MNTPLAERMRPKTLNDYFGQQHLVGSSGTLTQMIAHGVFPSLIFWGPPGTGKTTLAQLLAQEKNRPFYQLSAINTGVKEIREILQKAEHGGGLFTNKNPLLFIKRSIPLGIVSFDTLDHLCDKMSISPSLS